jgi:hypothetical protein
MAKRKKKGAPAAAGEGAVSVVAHPRARRSIRRLRAGAGLFGLVAVTYLSMRAGVPPFDAVLRGLAGGIAAHFVAWTAGIVAWRHLVVAELAAHREARQARLREPHEPAGEALAAQG